MLFIRRLSSQPVKEAQRNLTDYLQYFKTKKSMRPLVYRAKNASELISRDLWDPVAKQRVLPLEQPGVPSSKDLNLLIKDVSSVDELYQIRDQMIELGNKKIKYTTASHIISYLEKSAELSKLPHALTLIYSHPHLVPLLNADVLNMILTFLYINPKKSKNNTLEKTQNALKKIPRRNPISNLLKLAIRLKFDPAASPGSIIKKVENDTPVELPTIDSSKGPGVLAHQLNKNRTLFLTMKPIEETVGKVEKFAEIPNVKEIVKFVQEYEEIEKKLGVENAFLALKNKSVFEKPSTTNETSETVEEKTQDS